MLSAYITDKGTTRSLDAASAAAEAGAQIRTITGTQPDSVAVVLTGQYTSEEYDSFQGI